MKIAKKLAAVAVSTLMMFSITGMNVSAASTTQDGLEVTLSTDKEAYSKDDKITATLSVKNTNAKEVMDVAMETDIPDGYEVADGTKNNKQLDKLAPNESSELKVVYVAKDSGEDSQDSEVSPVSPNNDSPKTGDNAVIPIAIALVMIVSVLFVVLCFKSKKGRKLLSLILCVSSVCGYFVLAPIKVNAVDTILKSLNISTSVKIGTNDVSLNAIVRYSTEIFENPLSEYEIDTDSDGIPDVIENQLGLNSNNNDTDGDQLTDYFEYVNGVTDPKTADTDGNGISDFDEDSDDDGLKNGEEQAVGSYAFDKDSDDDELLDGDEVHKYSTDPMKKDTDGDGLTDYEEIKLGLDPLKISSDGSVNDSERKLPQTASDEVKDDLLRESDNWLVPQISGNVSGLLDNQISMIKDESLSFNDNHSIVSDVIEIDSSCTSALTLTFSFKENYTGNPKQLVIAYYDNDAHELHLVDSHLSDEQNKIEGEITSSGYYFVMDVDEFLKSLGIDVMKNINTSSVKTTSTSASTDSSIGKADIVFVVDTTSSMSDEIYNVQNNINTFADKMSNEYHVDMNYSLIEYRDIERDGVDSTIVHRNLSSNWFTNVNTFKSEVSGLTVAGGGDIPETPIDALELARTSTWRNGATKFVVLVTDVPSKGNNTSGIKDMDEMAQKFASDGIIVSVITYNKSDYTNLLEQTHGLYGYIYSNFSDILLQLADVIGTETHKGGDWIILDDYSVVQLKGSIEEITTIDSDEDGLKDSEELIEKKTVDLKPLIALVLNLSSGVSIGEYIGKTEIEVWTFKSNPTIPDTDYDGLDDLLDNEPRNCFIHSFVIYETEWDEEGLRLMNTYDGDDPRRHTKGEPDKNEFMFSEKTKSELCDLKWVNWTDFLDDAHQHETGWKKMVRLFSMGDMQKVAINMVDHFMNGNGSDYSNATLSAEVDKHEKTAEYVNGVRKCFEEQLRIHDGNLVELKYTKANRANAPVRKAMADKGINEPSYNDKFKGLGICVDSLYGNRIEVTEFHKNGDNYEYKLQFIMYDIFGLDDGDVTTHKYVDWNIVPAFGLLYGFRAWLILQHYDKYDGLYRPYISYMKFNRSFSGTL